MTPQSGPVILVNSIPLALILPMGDQCYNSVCCVCVFTKLYVTAQSSPVILVNSMPLELILPRAKGGSIKLLTKTSNQTRQRGVCACVWVRVCAYTGASKPQAYNTFTFWDITSYLVYLTWYILQDWHRNKDKAVLKVLKINKTHEKKKVLSSSQKLVAPFVY